MSDSLLLMQDEYFDLLTGYQSIMEKEPDIDSMILLIDNVHKFWLKKIPFVEKEINCLTKRDYSMLLSGAIYLDYEKNEHYVYKSLGNCHLLHDSIIKIEGLLRAPMEYINVDKVRGLMKKAYADEMLILKNARNHFYYTPLIILDLENGKAELLTNAFWSVISSLFDKKFDSKGEFIEKFHTYEEIEKKIGSKRLRHIITLSEDDAELSLRKRIDNYIDSLFVDKNLFKHNPEPSKFLFAMVSLINQVLDILLTCAYYNLTPFIRYNVTFHYFMLMMPNFLSDDILRKKIEDAVITYTFHHRIDKSMLCEIEFDEYCKKISDYNFFSKIRYKFDSDEINIFSGGLKKLISIIDDTISKFYKSYY